jgi:hypothetical protein
MSQDVCGTSKNQKPDCAAMYGAQASVLSGLFGARARYSGVSLGYNLASIRRCLAADHHRPGYFATETRRRAGA